MKVQFQLKKNSLRGGTFKAFVQNLEVDVSRRLMTEQKLLLSAFEKRGTAIYKDIKVQSAMAKSTGEKFNDPRISARYVEVPSGYLLSKIKLCVQNGLGLVGWQLFWNADGCQTLESTARGKVIGTGLTEYDVVFKPNDYLVEVEYIAEGVVMTGIRFRTFFGAWSKFYGAKPSQLSKRYLLSSDMASLPDGDPGYVAASSKEEKYPGMPAHYIIGFGGLETNTRATCLHIVVRKIIQQNIFTYTWVNDAPGPIKRTRSELTEVDEEPGEVEFPMVASASETPSRPPSSSIGIRNAKLAKHLADLNSFWPLHGDSDSEYTPDPPITLSSSEEQFFDVIRMRIVEIKAAHARALQFARAIWTSCTLPRGPLASITKIQILTGFAKWFFEGLSKSLVVCPPGSDAAEGVYASIRTAQMQIEILDNRITGLTGSVKGMETSERFKPWYGKALLGPQLREAKKEYQDELRHLHEMRKDTQVKRSELIDKVHALKESIDLLLPRFELSTTVVGNFRLKIAGARYKSNLLEKMSLESLKEHLGGSRASAKNYTFQLSIADQEKLRRNKALNDTIAAAVDMAESLFKEEEAIDEMKKIRQQMYATGGVVSFADGDKSVGSTRPAPFQPMLSPLSKIPNAVANQVLTNDDFSYTQTQKKTFRKYVAVNPAWGNVSKRPISRQLSRTMPPLGSRNVKSS